MKIINKTPHTINVGDKEFKPNGEPFRLEQVTENCGKLGEIPLSTTKFKGAELPPIVEDVYYIVSSILCQAYPNREDFLIVNETIRDKEGNITGCKSLAKNPFKENLSKGIYEELIKVAKKVLPEKVLEFSWIPKSPLILKEDKYLTQKEYPDSSWEFPKLLLDEAREVTHLSEVYSASLLLEKHLEPHIESNYDFQYGMARD